MPRGENIALLAGGICCEPAGGRAPPMAHGSAELCPIVVGLTATATSIT